MPLPLIAANWKMNPPPRGFDAPDSPYRPHKSVDVLVFAVCIHLRACLDAHISAGAQFGHPEDSGAFTGDVSMAMLKEEFGCSSVLCGHSDRRRFHHESNEFVAEQVAAARRHDITPIICVGETGEERRAGKTEHVLRSQMNPMKLDEHCILAYEPVWAISRGDPNTPAATPEDAETAHKFLRSLLPQDLQTKIRILYGGSMNAKNAEVLLSQPNIDGGLVGGASLKPDEFRAIVEIAAKMKK